MYHLFRARVKEQTRGDLFQVFFFTKKFRPEIRSLFEKSVASNSSDIFYCKQMRVWKFITYFRIKSIGKRGKIRSFPIYLYG